MANKKISDQIAIRLTGETVNGENFVDYSNYQNPGLSSSDRRDLGDTKFSRYRFKALFAPTEMPELLVKLSVDSERNAIPYAVDGVSSAGRSRELIEETSYNHYSSMNNATALTVNYALNDEWTFDSILSYQHSKTHFEKPQEGNPNFANHYNFTFNVHETSFEPKINYKSANSRSSSVVGAYYLTRSRSDFGTPGSSFDLDANDKNNHKIIVYR